MTKRHEGKAMLVTGAAGAIGYATCEILVREGAQVMLVDIDSARLEERVRTLSDAGHTVFGHHADCADEKQVEAYAQAALKAMGKVDGFFNNAGIEGDLAPTHEYDIAMFDKVLHVNLRGMFLGLRFVLPDMVRRGYGAVALFGQSRGAILQPVFRDINQHHLRALTAENFGSRKADCARSAGDDDRGALVAHGYFPLVLRNGSVRMNSASFGVSSLRNARASSGLSVAVIGMVP